VPAADFFAGGVKAQLQNDRVGVGRTAQGVQQQPAVVVHYASSLGEVGDRSEQIAVARMQAAAIVETHRDFPGDRRHLVDGGTGDIRDAEGRKD
jgi:hypothetical protein